MQPIIIYIPAWVWWFIAIAAMVSLINTILEIIKWFLNRKLAALATKGTP